MARQRPVFAINSSGRLDWTLRADVAICQDRYQQRPVIGFALSTDGSARTLPGRRGYLLCIPRPSRNARAGSISAALIRPWPSHRRATADGRSRSHTCQVCTRQPHARPLLCSSPLGLQQLQQQQQEQEQQQQQPRSLIARVASCILVNCLSL